MATARFRGMLAELSSRIRDQELEAMKYMCLDSIPRARQEEIETPIQLWIALEERDLLAPAKTDFLKELLAACSSGKTDLLTIVEEYEQTGLQATTLVELQKEFEIIADNLGKKWRPLARKLELSEADIDCLAENYSKNTREQIVQCLQTWKRKKKENATRAVLLEALRSCSLNMLAHQVETCGS